MSFDEFCRSVKAAEPVPDDLSPALVALWLDARNEWDRAHAAAQSDTTVEGSWVHAYLHRKEGDRSNASYWYARARRPVPSDAVPLDAEWAEITRALLR